MNLGRIASVAAGLVCLALQTTASASPILINSIAIPGNSSDKSAPTADPLSNRLGGFGSDIYYDRQANVFYGLSDRGPGGGVLSFDTRLQKFSLTVDGTTGAISNFQLLDTIKFTDANGQPMNGLNPGLLTGNAGTLGNSFDPEGLVVAPNGHFFVADEYGPSVKEFDAQGKLVRDFTVPANLVPKEASNAVNYVDGRPTITTGRQDNRGFEGLTVSPDGKILYAVLQDPLVNEGAQNDGRRGQFVRIVMYSVATGQPIGQFLYPLELLADINGRIPGTANDFGATAQGRNIGVSAIVAINDHQFFVLERDNRGVFSVDPAAVLPVGSKRVFLVDIAGATDVTNVSLAGGILPGGVATVTKTATPFIDMQAALAAQGLPLPEKVEGLTVGPQLANGGYLLLAGTDNDFSITQNSAGTQFNVCFDDVTHQIVSTTIAIGAGCPLGSSLMPSFLFAFATAPGDFNFTSSAVPEPKTLVLLVSGLGIAAIFRRRRPSRRE